MRRVLLVEPHFHVHTLVHFKAALSSTGYEDAKFVIATGGVAVRDRDRLTQFARDNASRVELRELPVESKNFASALDAWRGYAHAVAEVEKILRRETFDFFAYLMLDNTLPCFAAPGASRRLPAHFSAGVRGLLFRDNGFRPPPNPTTKERIRAWGDRLILHRALRSGALRKVAFYDHRCADAARAKYGEICGYGVDPMELPQSEPAGSRAKLSLPGDAWVALMFGVISGRKGVVETVNILADADLDPARLVLLLAGPVEADVRSALEAAVEKARRRFRVIWHDAFVADEDLADYFAAADCVICAYKRFNASSGVLLHAAAHGKPAIVSREGTMHDAVERYGFGEAVNLDDPRTLTAAVFRLMNLPDAERGKLGAAARKYAESMDARRYMAQFE